MEGVQRWRGLDAFRGLVVAAMILVNTPGDWQAAYGQLKHAPWHGFRLADLIFPAFLFMVGITLRFSLARLRSRGWSHKQILSKTLRRAATLFLLGLSVNTFPFFRADIWPAFRIPGVLQRIAICFVGATLVELHLKERQKALLLAILLLGYWAVLMIPVSWHGQTEPFPLDSPEGNIAAFLDRAIFGAHLWGATKNWDPEGLLSTLSALSTVLMGSWCGALIFGSGQMSQKVWRMALAGVLAITLALAWSLVYPINKALWTGSFALLTAGTSALGLAAAAWLVDIKGYSRWVGPFIVFGSNPILAYLTSEYAGMALAEGATPLVHSFLVAQGFSGANASLAFSLAFLCLCSLPLASLYKNHIILRA